MKYKNSQSKRKNYQEIEKRTDCAVAVPGIELLKLKVGTEADVEGVLAKLSEHMNHQQRAAFRDKLDRYVHKPDRDLILALQTGQVLGLVCVIDQAEFPSSLPEQTVERLRNFACSTQLLVHPRLRKQGIGSRLQLRAEQWARERGRAGLWLVTHRMAHWYRRHFGYQEVGRTHVRNAEKIVMAKDFPQSNRGLESRSSSKPCE